MDRTATEIAIKIHWRKIPLRLREWAGIAKAFEAFANSGEAVQVSDGIEQPSYDASRLLDAVSLLNRLSQDE